MTQTHHQIQLIETFIKCNIISSITQYRRPSLFAIFFICEFAYSHWKKMAQNDNFPVKNGLLICEFKIRGGPMWRNLSTANNEGNLYLPLLILFPIHWYVCVCVCLCTLLINCQRKLLWMDVVWIFPWVSKEACHDIFSWFPLQRFFLPFFHNYRECIDVYILANNCLNKLRLQWISAKSSNTYL